ncbi:MAG: ABC transporter permease [Rhodospirillales bacterium]|nr:ABC transporter permease [Rhodospirillales bacterium]
MLLSPYASFADRLRLAALFVWCGLVLAFLVLPIFVPVPLSVNSEAFFTFPLAGFSWRWYREVLQSVQWREAAWHSIIIAIGVTVLATTLGTLAAVGLSSPRLPARRLIMGLLISPLIVPVIITAVGAYIFYAQLGLASTFTGIILAHTAVASPFVVVTVGASLSNFDRSLMQAAAICGARPFAAFRRVMLPLILPGVLSGAAFAFVTSFDELVIAMFLASADQRTLPMQMFVGLREHLSPAITAVATLMMTLSIVLLVVADRLRRRGRRGAVDGRAQPFTP